MIRIRILGADSFGSRSMATVVTLDEFKLFIDPGVSYAPRRYGLPPHPLELSRYENIKDEIVKELEDSDYVVITHYHYDHYLREPEYADLFRGKVLLVKHPSSKINFSQKMRAYHFLKKNRVEEIAREVIYADSKRIALSRDVELVFSPPVPHGSPGTKLGNVIMVSVKCCDARFVHASDVQGPVSEDALNWILEMKPDILFISGPPTYFAGFKVPVEEVEAGLHNLKLLAQRIEGTIIADHHFARDLKYPEYVEQLANTSRARILSAAQFMGRAYEPLEALRRRLWEQEDGKQGNSY